jgi:hypothetical protein
MEDAGELSIENWQKIFGDVDADAEEEAFFSSHFVSDFKYKMFASSDTFKLVVGNKGTGKTAFLRKFRSDQTQRSNVVTVNIDAPKLIHDMPDTATSGAAAIYKWREYFQIQAANHILSDRIEDITGLKRLMLDGVVNGFVNRLAQLAQTKTASLSDEVLKLGKRIDENTQVVFIVDDLDKGWSGKEVELAFVRNLITAMYDVGLKDKSIAFRISLRWDIFDQISRTMADIDKIRPHIVYLTWSPHEIYVIGAKRISVALNRSFLAEYALGQNIDQGTLAQFYDPVVERRFCGEGGWANTASRRVMMSFVRRRPRDLFAFLGKAAEKALNAGRKKIRSDEISAIFKPYSDDRVNDLIAEYSSRLPALQKVIDSFRPPKRTHASDAFRFTNDRIYKHANNFIASGVSNFADEKTPLDAKRFIEFLYRIEFIQAYRIENNFIKRFDFDIQQKISDEQGDLGFSWEVLPAYRWSLSPVDRNLVTASLKVHLNEG